jgi:hypothetical protein
MGAAAIDVEVVEDFHTATGVWRYQIRFTLAKEEAAKPSPWFTPALHEHLQLAHREGPPAIMLALEQLRPDAWAWLSDLPPKLSDAVVVHAWGPRRSPHGPADDPGAP